MKLNKMINEIYKALVKDKYDVRKIKDGNIFLINHGTDIDIMSAEIVEFIVNFANKFAIKLVNKKDCMANIKLTAVTY